MGLNFHLCIKKLYRWNLNFLQLNCPPLSVQLSEVGMGLLETNLSSKTGLKSGFTRSWLRVDLKSSKSCSGTFYFLRNLNNSSEVWWKMRYLGNRAILINNHNTDCFMTLICVGINFPLKS